MRMRKLDGNTTSATSELSRITIFLDVTPGHDKSMVTVQPRTG